MKCKLNGPYGTRRLTVVDAHLRPVATCDTTEDAERLCEALNEGWRASEELYGREKVATAPQAIEENQ